jgi:hypothetical protein
VTLITNLTRSFHHKFRSVGYSHRNRQATELATELMEGNMAAGLRHVESVFLWLLLDTWVTAATRISDLDTLGTFMDQKDPFVVVTYLLCPNTVFHIGWSDQDLTYHDGSRSISPRANTRIICGADGSSANQCLVQGFGPQVMVVDPSVAPRVENVKVMGITFDSWTSTSVTLGSAIGNFEFH